MNPAAASWARWWLFVWGAMTVVLIFLLPFRWWAITASVGFGIMEGLGLLRPHDPYPPLTHVIRKYLPRWLAFTMIYGFTGAAGGEWFGFQRPERVGALFALLGWFTAHFDVAFDADKSFQDATSRFAG